MRCAIFGFRATLLALKNILKTLQLETYLLIILPIIWILLTLVFEKSIFPIILQSNKLKIMSFFYGGCLIEIGVKLFFLYIYLRMIVFLGQWAEEKLSKKGNAYATHIKHFVLSVGYVMLSIVLYNFVLLLCLTQISVASSPTEVSHYSQLFMAIDQRIFGVYPHFWIQSTVFNAIDYVLIQTYCKLAVFFTIVLIGLLLFDKKNFRKFLIAIFISPFLAMPIWYGLPAVTPNEMYRQNIFSLDAILPSQQDYAAVITSDHLKYFFKRLEKHIENPSQNHPLVSTNPSMHVAWATIITYFAMVLWTPLGLVFVPWLLLIMVSTLYTMQHYAIDLPGGLLCAAITILITNYLFKFEKKYYTGSYTPLYFVTIVQTDIQALKAWWATKAQARSRLNQAVVE